MYLCFCNEVFQQKVVVLGQLTNASLHSKLKTCPSSCKIYTQRSQKLYFGLSSKIFVNNVCKTFSLHKPKLQTISL